MATYIIINPCSLYHSTSLQLHKYSFPELTEERSFLNMQKLSFIKD